jgi:opacity protein-like surface antigen
VTDAGTGDFITDHVRNIDFEDTWFGEGGVGCGSGSRGFRGEVTIGYHGDRKYDGEPGPWNPAGPPPLEDPLHTSITSYTLMLNGYKDLGNFRGFTPYLGAGVGIAYNMVDDVYFTQNPALVNQIHGDKDIAFAWSLMAGVGYQISPRSVIDVGYRYLNMGKATSERSDTAGFVNPRVNFDDIDAHEVKVGLRYHFGQSDCCAYQAMK